ncbi:MAG: alpha/beta hydrolase [Caldilinea sp. CFX5]|nr:alpha/beta hydrolase [Caldilinea sp. CFX5]
MNPYKKIVRVASVLIVSTLGSFILGLLLWDGGFAAGDHRVLLPDVVVNLQTVTTTRGPVQYDLYGTQGPVILSIHAGLGGADQGRLFARWLQGEGFRILSPSRPGYLGTPLTSGRTLAEQADLLAALLDQLQIDRVGVVAASAGSPVAYAFAARYPQRVWALVSISGVSRPAPQTSLRSSSVMQTVFMNSIGQKLVKLVAAVAPQAVVAGTLDETSYFTDEQKAERVAYIMTTADKRAFFQAMFTTTFPYSERTPGTDNDAAQTQTLPLLAFAKITAPTLIIHGAEDADVPFADGVYAYEQIPGAQRYWMAHEDHLGFWLSPAAEQAQAVAKSFLQRHAPDRERH